MPTVSYLNSTFSYDRFGTGKEIIVAFPGYDRLASDFRFFEDALASGYSVISVDLCAHGETKWKEERAYANADFLEVLQLIFKAENLNTTNFHVVAYSLGTRFATSFVGCYPELLRSFVLISPPSSAFNHFVQFASDTFLGKMMFRFLLVNRRVLLWIAGILNGLGILKDKKYQFVTQYIREEVKLQQVHETWKSYRKWHPRFAWCAKQLQKANVATILITGKHDRITPPNRSLYLLSDWKQLKHLQTTEGHRLETMSMKEVLGGLFSAKNI
jgi:pimeloyl-ACP methyl ester carboxylesterase